MAIKMLAHRAQVGRQLLNPIRFVGLLKFVSRLKSNEAQAI